MPVQEQVLANAFGGQDLYVQSQTGTGKTAAFLIVIFQRLLAEPLLAGKKAIIMVPTRELAVQVEEEAKLLGKYLPFKMGSFYGGVSYTQQQQTLKDNAQILVGTPGRVLDLNQSGYMNLMDIAFLVLDEADRMFDMGFYPDLRKLIKAVPPVDRRQTMLFSATLNAWVKNLAWEYTKSPLEIEIAPETVTVDEVDQRLYHVQSHDKMKILLGILKKEAPESAIIFCNTKRYTEIVAKRLAMNGYECEFIIGDLPQSKRLRIIDDIKAGAVRYLVATDVAARGLDIADLALVVNYDVPNETENYVHRIGRTARAGKTGKAITLASELDVYELPAIEKYIGKKIAAEVAGEDLYAPDKSEGSRVQTAVYRERKEAPKEEKRLRWGRRSGQRRRSREYSRSGTDGRPFEKEGRAGREGGGREEERETRGPWRDARDRRDKRDRRDGKGEGRQGFQRSGPFRRRRPEIGDEDISHLSFDERMLYYKRKYGNRKPAHRAKAGADGFPPQAPAAGNKGQERGRPAPAGAEKSRAPERDRQAPAPRNGPGSKKPAEQSGLLERFFGFLRRLVSKKD
jgi:ATP-dependent RNA helicase RhlB